MNAKKNIRSQTYSDECNKNEILARFGLLHIIGTQRASKLNIKELWLTKFGITAFRVSISEQWFRYLLFVLTFDDKTKCSVRDLDDNLAAIRGILHQCNMQYAILQKISL